MMRLKHLRKKFQSSAVVSTLMGLGLFGQSANAQLITAPVAPENSRFWGAYLSLNEVDYELENNTSAEIDRKILGVDFNNPINEKISVFGHGGLIFDSELDPGTADDGKGLIFGGGLRASVFRTQGIEFFGYGLLDYSYEKLEVGDDNETIKLMELIAGGSATFRGLDNLVPYAAVELVPFSDGEGELDAGNKIEFDIERDDFLGLKLGTFINLKGMFIRPEIALLHEQTFSIAFLSAF
ncbi:MAG: hypothetical protein AB7T49_07955 [Oligoflexales bacterium]